LRMNMMISYQELVRTFLRTGSRISRGRIMATRVEMIIETLKANPDKKFTARDLAKEFVLRWLC
ncbi:hypothetical protein, partial [Klebsiella variicola]